MLAETFTEISTQHLHELCDLGALYLDGQRVQLKQFDDPVACQAYFRLHTQPRRFPEVTHLRSRIIFEDEDLLVINKPHGVPTHATVDNRKENLLYLLEKELGQKIYITHRLDVPTAGLMVYAKNLSAQEHFNRLIRSGQINKSYLAHTSVHPKPNESATANVLPLGPIRHYMQPSARGNKVVSTHPEPGWQECLLKIKTANTVREIESNNSIASDESASKKIEFTIDLITGRTHQIRAQLSALGYPILGDKNYGGAIWNDSPFDDSREQIALWSTHLNFKNFEGQELSFELPKPT